MPLSLPAAIVGLTHQPLSKAQQLLAERLTSSTSTQAARTLALCTYSSLLTRSETTLRTDVALTEADFAPNYPHTHKVTVGIRAWINATLHVPGNLTCHWLYVNRLELPPELTVQVLTPRASRSILSEETAGTIGPSARWMIEKNVWLGKRLSYLTTALPTKTVTKELERRKLAARISFPLVRAGLGKVDYLSELLGPERLPEVLKASKSETLEEYAKSYTPKYLLDTLYGKLPHDLPKKELPRTVANGDYHGGEIDVLQFFNGDLLRLHKLSALDWVRAAPIPWRLRNEKALEVLDVVSQRSTQSILGDNFSFLLAHLPSSAVRAFLDQANPFMDSTALETALKITELRESIERSLPRTQP